LASLRNSELIEAASALHTTPETLRRLRREARSRLLAAARGPHLVVTATKKA
jgi:hypothetical protein